MGKPWRYLRWVHHPKVLVLFVAACLCAGAAANTLRPVSAAIRNVAAVGSSINRLAVPAPDCSALPCVALTFDDGPSSESTPRILDALAAQHVHATFFVVGYRIAGNEALLRRIHAEGNEVGNHSWNHADFTTLSPAQIDQQIEATQAAVVAAGLPAPTLFRPPYGAMNDVVKSHMDLTVVRWNVDPADWRDTDPAKIYANIIAQAKPGGIIILHDRRPATADALPAAIQALKARYQLVTAGQLMSLTPGDQGQYFGR